MRALAPGWYVFTAPNAADTIALDRIGPFESRAEVFDWMAEFKVEYRPNAEAYQRAVLYAGEMTDQESDRPWATAVHQIGSM